MKDKKASIIYAALTVIIWQFCISLSKILTNKNFFSDTKNYLFFNLTKTENKGAAFGIFQDSSLFLGLLGVFVFIFVIYFVFKNFSFEDKAKILNTSIFSAGILGNTVERLSSGYVTDFIKLTIFNFPVFNLFDILISVSVFVYIFLYLKNDFFKKGKNGNKSRN